MSERFNIEIDDTDISVEERSDSFMDIPFSDSEMIPDELAESTDINEETVENSEFIEEVAEINDFSDESLISHYRDIGIDEMTIQQLMNAPDDRTWRGLENIDALQHPDFDTQKSFISDGEDGYLETSYGTKDSQRPDEIRFSEKGIDIREAKNYSNVDSLIQNITKQATDRYELFGEDLNDLTFVVSPKFTLEECERLYQTCHDADADIEFKYH